MRIREPAAGSSVMNMQLGCFSSDVVLFIAGLAWVVSTAFA